MATSRQASALATTFNTRKSVGQNQLGLVLERQLSDTDSVRLRAYGGGRQLTQYLSFSGAAANSAGGVVDLDRSYQGAAATWTRAVRLPSGLPLTWTVGAEANRLSEHRQGFVNNAGTSCAAARRARQCRQHRCVCPGRRLALALARLCRAARQPGARAGG